MDTNISKYLRINKMKNKNTTQNSVQKPSVV